MTPRGLPDWPGPYLGDGITTCRIPRAPRRRGLQPATIIIITAVIAAPVIWYGAPLAMVIIKALGEML